MSGLHQSKAQGIVDHFCTSPHMWHVDDVGLLTFRNGHDRHDINHLYYVICRSTGIIFSSPPNLATKITIAQRLRIWWAYSNNKGRMKGHGY
jgi:hypothetical protein